MHTPHEQPQTAKSFWRDPVFHERACANKPHPHDQALGCGDQHENSFLGVYFNSFVRQTIVEKTLQADFVVKLSDRRVPLAQFLALSLCSAWMLFSFVDCALSLCCGRFLLRVALNPEHCLYHLHRKLFLGVYFLSFDTDWLLSAGDWRNAQQCSCPSQRPRKHGA